MYTVMCIDDVLEDLFEALPVLQQKLSANIITARSYTTALSMLSNQKVDIFIIDIELSDGRNTGIQLAEHIRQNSAYTTTPIIFVSMYSHYSKRLMTNFQSSAFLTKPVQSSVLLNTVGAFLGIPEFIRQNVRYEPFIIPLYQNSFIEVNPNSISYIELNRNELTIQYINGQVISAKCPHGCFKTILQQIKAHSISHLRQIYRSIIINVDQVKKIELNGNVGSLWLFGDPIPKPIGSIYKNELSDIL